MGVAGRKRSTVRDLRRDNRSVLLWSLFFTQPCSRQDLSWATGLSAGSVSNVVRELIDDGIVTEAGSVDSDGGRPRALLRMDPDYGRVIGVDVGETRIRVEMFDTTMTMRASADYALDPQEHGIDVVADRVRAGLASVLADGNCAASRVLGVGIGVPGVVEHDGAEALVYAQTYGWDAVPLGRLLRTAGDFPLYIDNGAKTMGQAELWFGAGRGARQAVVCLMGSGLGASIVTGTPGLGGTSASLEWGHTTVEVGGRSCRCGSHGCLEAYVGAGAILDRYGRSLSGEDEESALASLVAAADEADEQAVRILDETALYLGAGIADLVNLFGPERIILGGWAGLLLGQRILPAVTEAARQHALHHRFAQTSIELGGLGPDAVALGAATLPMERFLDGALATHSSDRAAG
ncbi:MAG TPA: ROK family transcriptional regulator [Trebonia sp.]|jgi:predicted NBD/HSP70 family sugar kinase|nr:ROK family transcriptional regulator [Trebonia sp.]